MRTLLKGTQAFAAAMLVNLIAGCGEVSSLPTATFSAGAIGNVSVVTATFSDQPTIQPARALLPPENLTTVEMHARLDPFTNPPQGCSLPCYNNLIAGQASVNDVYDFYSHLGIGLSDLIPGDYPGIQDGSGRLAAWLTKTRDAADAEAMGLAAPLVTIYVTDTIMETLSIGWEYLPPYLPILQVLNQMGQPDDLLIGILPLSTETATLIELRYSERQTAFVYFVKSVPDSQGLRVCLDTDSVESVSMGIARPGLVPLDGLQYSETLKPLGDALGMGYPDFAAAMMTTGCLEISAAALSQWK
jgi:hypothetical protein